VNAWRDSLTKSDEEIPFLAAQVGLRPDDFLSCLLDTATVDRAIIGISRSRAGWDSCRLRRSCQDGSRPPDAWSR